MNFLFPVLAIILVVFMLPPLYRVVKGPTLFDRIVAAGLMGTNGVLILATIVLFMIGLICSLTWLLLMHYLTL
jgi:multisubunit Na+/H+ antiporter MnhF subunit